MAGLTEKLVLEDPVQFLQYVEEAWQLHCDQMKRIASIFLYLDRTYVLTITGKKPSSDSMQSLIGYPGVKSLFDLGLQIFRHHLCIHPEVRERTLAGLLKVIEHERRGFSVDRGILKSLLKMFSLIGIYDTHFQTPFLEETAKFYQEESEHNLISWDIPQYLLYCEVEHFLSPCRKLRVCLQQRLSEEHDRSDQYLDRMTHRYLLNCAEEQLLRARIDTILLGFSELMDTNRTDDLGRLFNLCSTWLFQFINADWHML